MSQFQKGHPGGPGRPIGSRNVGKVFLEQLGQEAAADLLKAVIERGRKGDPRAVEIVLDRIWPKRRGCPVELELAPLKEPKDLVLAQAAVVEAVASGTLTPQEASDVANVMEKQRLAIETADHEIRLTALEERRNVQKPAPSRWTPKA